MRFMGVDFQSRVGPRPRGDQVEHSISQPIYLVLVSSCDPSLTKESENWDFSWNFLLGKEKLIDCMSRAAGGHLALLGESLPENKTNTEKSRAKKRGDTDREEGRE